MPQAGTVHETLRCEEQVLGLGDRRNIPDVAYSGDQGFQHWEINKHKPWLSTV
jgi:hypothetical protein